MKLRAILAAAALILATNAQSATPTGPATAVPTATTASVATRTLGNGMRVVVVEDHAAAVVQVAMWYRFGSDDETVGKTGLAHGLEHMMFRGTSALSGGGIDEIAARLGANVNATTAEDYTHYYTVLPADRLDLALHIEADRMRGLVLRENDWQLEKGAVLAEYDGDYSQPVFALATAVRGAMYAGSPYGRSPLGVRADVAHAHASDLRAYYDRWYRPDNATLVVTGDVRPDDVFTRAEATFGAIAKANAPLPTPVPIPEVSPAARTVRQTADYPYAVVDLAYRIPGDLDADAAATQTFPLIVNSERSKFYDALVRSGLTLGFNASADTGLHAGTVHVLLFVTPGKSPETARRAFETTLAATRSAGVDPELLSAAKVSEIRQAIYARDSISGLGDRYGYAYGVEGHDPSVDDARISAIDPQAMNAAVTRYFSTPSAVGYLTPRAPKPGAAPGGSASQGVSDDFSKRAPTGPIVLAPWAKAALAQPVTIASKVNPQQFRLPNGLRLLVQRIPANPTVFISGSIRLSPKFDPPQKTGTAGLTAALLSYGSEHYDFDAQRKVADDLGADIAVGAQFSAHGLARDLDALLAVLADGVQHPAFPERYVELLRSQEVAAISQREHNPDARADRAFAQAIYAPNDPTLRQTTIATVKSIARADMQAFAARYFRPDETTVVVAGDVEPATVEAAINRAFGAWHTAGPPPSYELPPIPPTKPAVRVIPADRPAVSVRLGERAIARRSPDFYAFNLLNGVLGNGGGFDTRLMHEIRERRGLVYGVNSALLVSRDRGTFEISMSASPANVRAAVRLAKAEVAHLTRDPIAPTELDRARQKLVAGALVGEESTSAIVQRCENIATNDLPTDYYATLAARYGAITPADTLRVAKTYLHPTRFVEVYEGAGTIAR